MTSEELKMRTKKFSLLIIDLVEKLPNTISSRTIASQIVRSGTSVGANYRAVCRARSDREFIAKWQLLLKKLMRLYFGWKLFKKKSG
ncbi:MAG TPA: four helix bundle protein [Flavobacterium sp.]|nr:four helix bundle protein [Flavobacterium sp.]